jgi:hypothetical protein
MGRRTRLVPVLAIALLCGVYVAVSAPSVWKALIAETAGPPTAFFSTDRDIEGLSGIRNGSERIIATLAALPGRKRLVVILPKGDEASIYFAFIIAYLGWPREVEAIQIDPSAVAERVRQLDPKTFAAILFCRVSPPAFVPSGTTWAKELTLVRSPAIQEEAMP